MLCTRYSAGALFGFATLAACLCLGSAECRAAERADTATYLKVFKDAEKATSDKKWTEAADLWTRVVEMNPQLGANWGKLARAHYEAKDYEKAIPAYVKVIELREGYPWSAAYDISCCYALLGEKEQAIYWLAKAFSIGFREVDHARTDSDLKSLHDDRRFKELVGIVDVSKMSRDEGWRYDLGWLAREIKRLHYSPFRKVSREEFEAYVKKLQDDIPKLSDHQIEVSLMRLMQMCGDGHTQLQARRWHESAPGTGASAARALPVQFYLFEEGLFIAAAAPKHKELAGRQVLRVGAHAVDEVMKAVLPLISRDNDIWPKYVAPALLRRPEILNGLGLIPEDDRVQLTLRDSSGKEETVALATEDGDPAPAWITARQKTPGAEPLYLKNLSAAYWFEYVPQSKLVYFQYNRVQNDPNEPLDKFCARLFQFIQEHDVDKLVVDMRWNHGGNNFLNKPLVHGLIRCDKINQRGKLFVVVGRNTFSAAMCGATQIERHTNAIFAGEPTGSSPNFVGESIPVNLPYSKMRGTISDLYWQNSVAMDYRTWIAPTLYAPPSFELYRAKRDPALEAILAYKE